MLRRKNICACTSSAGLSRKKLPRGQLQSDLLDRRSGEATLGLGPGCVPGSDTDAIPNKRCPQVTDLKSVLPALGVHEVFTERADLSTLSPVRGAHVSAWRHVACFSATERGGKPDRPSSGLCGTALDQQPASDEVSNSQDAERPRFVVDRPFMFLILNDDVDFFLLFGIVRK
ncbi:hypothetical protein HPB48_003346 [Haemaphysalis longicornis]|uniref:Serpin domain-containing protein n=1 Tax=Haemaphysalis longicornis TaxID=44386 RepID=A0A9J6GAS0_HAELO|nr:hypothetical protein HPB48_003346 [Haemaphysalis longicornis]